MLFYLIVFFVILVLLYLGKRYYFLERIGILLLILLSVCRFDIGNDYDNYCYLIDFSTYLLKEGDWESLVYASQLLGLEPFFELLCVIFKDIQYHFVYIFAAYSILTILIWYKLLRDIEGVFEGFFLIITMSYLFISFDQIRQVLAVSLFVFSYKYIEQQNWKKFLIIILLASCVHYSVLFISIAYFLLNRKPNIKLYLYVIVFLYIGFRLDFWSQFRSSLFSLVGIYSNYSENDRQLMSGDFNSGLGFLFQILFYSYLMLVLRKKYPLLTNSLFIGVSLLLFSSGNLNINRIAYYFTFSSILAFPLYVKQEYRKIKVYCLLFLMIIYGGRSIYTGISGCVPYDSIWSKNFEVLNFRIREYRLENI